MINISATILLQSRLRVSCKDYSYIIMISIASEPLSAPYNPMILYSAKDITSAADCDKHQTNSSEGQFANTTVTCQYVILVICHRANMTVDDFKELQQYFFNKAYKRLCDHISSIVSGIIKMYPNTIASVASI